jgi:hypothetical protein
MAERTEQEIREVVERAPYTYAMAYQGLLGADWEILAGWRWIVRHVSGGATINAKTQEIEWLDLAPDGEPRERRTVKVPMYTSIGATLAIARALAEIAASD